MQALVIGAGPSGLAAAGALRRRGIEAVVIDKEAAVGSSWRARYEGLRLNTPRQLSHLPGARIARSCGRWVRREDFVAYLEGYADSLAANLRLGIEAERIERTGGGWTVLTSDGTVEAVAVVVATGFDRVPKLPSWPGRDGYKGELLHASRYRRASDFAHRDALVVGAGTTGNEIAAQLLEAGASQVRVAVRNRQTIFPRQWGGIPMAALGYPRPRPPAAVLDRVGRRLERMIWGDLGDLGLSPPPAGIATMLERAGHSIAVDSGLIEAVRRGRVEIVAAVEGLDGDEVCLADGARISPEVVIVATGYERGLEGLVGHLPGALLEDGRPAAIGGEQALGLPGLHFIGYRLPVSGQLPELRRDARALARAIAA